mgnify:CR=1 FL=1
MATREVALSVHDPYVDSVAQMHGQQVPLAANFTAGYGLWLARSGFATQSLRTLFGLSQGIADASIARRPLIRNSLRPPLPDRATPFLQEPSPLPGWPRPVPRDQPG